MKKLFTLTFIAVIIAQSQSVLAQCTLVASANPTVICVGDSALLTATATMPGSYYTFDFNDALLPPGWTVGGGFVFGSVPCASPSLDGSPFYWSSTAATTPSIQTPDLDVSAGGNLSFDFRFVGNSSVGPCETADQPNEGVLIEYSLDGGATWTSITYFCSVPTYPGLPANQQWPTLITATFPGNGNGSTGIYDNWANYSVIIPLAAQTASTRFRWSQPNSSGACCDNWGLDNISVNAQPDLYYDWSNGLDGFGATSQYITNLMNDTCLLVSVTDTNTLISCYDTVCITVNQLPDLIMSYSNPYCVGELVSFDNSASSAGITSFQYDLDNNGTFEVSTASPTYNAVGYFNIAGNYAIHIKGTTAGGCEKEIDTLVQVYNLPNVNLIANPSSFCPGDSINLFAPSAIINPPGQSSAINNYIWDFDDDNMADSSGASLDSILNYVYSPAGNYEAHVWVHTNMGCSREDSVSIVVNDVPQGNAVIPQICENAAGVFNFNNTGDPISDYTWDFGVTTSTSDTSDLGTPSFTYPGAGTYNLTLVVTTVNGCVGTLNSTVTVDPAPTGLIPNTAICAGHTETFSYDHTSNDTITNLAWLFPSGSPPSSSDVNPEIDYAVAGPTSVIVVVTNQFGCNDTVVKDFIVNTLPSPDFAVYPICISRFTFDPLSSDNDGQVLNWNMGDGTTYDNVDTTFFNHLYYNAGTYTVSLVVTDANGCSDSSEQQVVVNDSMVAHMPNVLYRSSSMDNYKVDMEVVDPGFNLCIEYTYTIFDRWGIKVFETHNDPLNPDLFCNGCFQGKAQNGAALSAGVYYYIMKGNFHVQDVGYITVFE